MMRLLSGVLCVALIGTSSVTSAAQSKVKHVVVLMLENRSFDHMVGFNKQKNPDIDGCLPSDSRCTNPADPQDPTSPTTAVSGDAVYVQPADPSHSVNATSQQVFGVPFETYPLPTTPGNMSGFVANYARSNPSSRGGGEFIMKCFSPEHLPVMSTLVEEFAVFNDWHAAIPGPTMVNRAFADSATSYGHGANDDLDIALGYPQRTIYADLAEANVDWRVYFELVPTSLQFADTRYFLFDNYRLYSNNSFFKDASNGDLASYTFLDPRYYELFGHAARDQHPNHDVGEGETMIKEVYEALRASPKWNETLLLITYDEHGGFFDHVTPPSGIPSPDGKVDTIDHFDFTRLGVRVPAIAVSPWTSKGAVINAPAGSHFEHSSIPKSLHQLFTPNNTTPLTKREAFASPFHTAALDRDTIRTDCPMTLPHPLNHTLVTPGLLPHDGSVQLKPSGLQRELAAMAAGVAAHVKGDVDGVELAAALAQVKSIEGEHDLGLFAAQKMNEAFGFEMVPIPKGAPSRPITVADA